MLARTAALLRIQPPVVDNRGLLFGSGADYPTLGDDGWQTGAIWCNTTGSTGTSFYVNEGSVTSCNFVPVDTSAGASTGAIDFDDNITGPLISIETTTPTNNSYTTPFLITGAYSSSADNALVLSATNQRPVSFLFEDSAAVLGSGNYRAVLSRVLLASTQTGQVSIRAIRGQVKALDGLALNIGENEFSSINGVEGYMELAGTTARTVGATTRVAAVHALLEVRQDITLTSGGKVCGYLAELCQTTTKSVSGIGSAAFAADRISSGHASQQAPWTVGFVTGDSSCTTGMMIGTCTDAITIGTCTDGITITGATAYALDIQTSGVIRVGIQDTGVPINNTYPYALQVHCETKTDFAQPGSGVSAGIYCRYLHEFDQTTATGHAAMFAKFRVKNDLADGVHSGINAYVEISGTVEIGGTATTQTSAGTFCVEAPSTLDLSTGYLCGITIDSSVNSSATTTGAFLGAWIKRAGTSHAWDEGIRIDSGSSVIGINIGTCTTAIAAIDKIVLSPDAAGTMLDFELETQWVSGTLIRADFGNSTTYSGAVIGVELDLGTSIVATSEQNVTGISITLPQATNTAADTALRGVVIAASGAITAGTSGDPTFIGVEITTPAINCTADTITSTGVHVTTGTSVQTSGTSTTTAFLATGGTLTTGTVNAVTLAGTFTTGVNLTATVTTGLAISGTTGTGLSIGACTTAAINITGGTASGLLIAGDCTTAAMNITSTGTLIGLLYNVDMTAQIGANVEGIKVILERTADVAVGTSNILGAEFIIKQGSDSYAAGMAPQITGVRIAMGGANTKATVVGLKCETQSNGYVDYLGIFSVNDSCTLASGGAVLYVRSYPTAAKLLKIEQPAATTATDGICLTDNAGTGTITNLITISARNSTNLFNFDYVGTGCVSSGSDSTNCTHKIAVKVESGTRYIHLFSD